jgi:hypothetical protein
MSATIVPVGVLVVDSLNKQLGLTGLEDGPSVIGDELLQPKHVRVEPP